MIYNVRKSFMIQLYKPKEIIWKKAANKRKEFWKNPMNLNHLIL